MVAVCRAMAVLHRGCIARQPLYCVVAALYGGCIARWLYRLVAALNVDHIAWWPDRVVAILYCTGFLPAMAKTVNSHM